MDCGPGPGKGGQKKAKIPPFAAVPPANPKMKTVFFFDFKQKTCWIRGWFG